MKSARPDLPVATELPEGTLRQTTWGDTHVQAGDFVRELDTGPYFKCLPDGRCPCHHWGYVVKGRMRNRYADREEIHDAGDVCCAAPGHLPILDAGTACVEFTPIHEMTEAQQIVAKRMQTVR